MAPLSLLETTLLGSVTSRSHWRAEAAPEMLGVLGLWGCRV